MAGSRKWFKYVDDAGATWALQADESNAEAVNGTTQDYVAGDVGTVTNAVPRNVKMRTATYGNENGRSLTIPVLTLSLYTALPTGVTSIPDPIGGTTVANLQFLRKRPEVRMFPRPDDTGLNDGDAS